MTVQTGIRWEFIVGAGFPKTLSHIGWFIVVPNFLLAVQVV